MPVVKWDSAPLLFNTMHEFVEYCRDDYGISARIFEAVIYRGRKMEVTNVSQVFIRALAQWQ